MLGRIYTIKCSEDPRVYVGSTYKSLEDRFRKHVNCSKCEVYKHRPLYLTMNEYGPDKFTIELLEEVDDVEKSMLRRIEGMHIEQHMDSLIPLFNKNIAGRDSKQYDKQYYEANKEYIREQKKQYYEANKEYIRENKKKQYHEANKENKERMMQPVQCECGAVITKYNLKRHRRSQKHIDWESSQ